jgi:hypothetical protein
VHDETDETDETIERIAAALRPLPDVDPAQKAKVLVAVAAERQRSRERRVTAARGWRMAGAAGVLAAAGLVAAVWLRSARSDANLATTAAPVVAPVAVGPATVAPSPGAVDARLAARDAKVAGLKSVQLVLRAPAARRVSLVGDFNGWDAEANLMARDPASGLWSYTLGLTPGRHVYAFIVDDSVWMRDPRSPEAVDEDFGRPGSVLLVGQP